MTHRLVLPTFLVVLLAFSLALSAALANAQIPQNSAPAQTRTARVIAEKANLREMPSSTSLVEGEVPEGMVVKVLDENLPWYVVRVGDRVGWMHGATLRFTDTTTTSERRLITVTPPTVTYSLPEPTSSTGGKVLIRGPRGGCYYISGSGRKVYVDRSMCN